MISALAEVEPAVARGSIRAPPSKSYTHRALVGAFLAEGPSRILGPSESDDVGRTVEGLRTLGATLRRSEGGWEVVPPSNGPVDRSRVDIDCAESGTTFRFLTAVAAIRPTETRFHGSMRLARRPIRELLGALHRAGAAFRGPTPGRSLPFAVRGPIHAGVFRLRGKESSQPHSALALVLPTLHGSSELRLPPELVSRPYVEATLAFLRSRAIDIDRVGDVVRFGGGQRYPARAFRVPGDASSAAYLWAAGAVSGGRVRVDGLPRAWPQADRRILSLLCSMGARVEERERSATVSGSLDRGVDADLTDAPDLLPLLAVLAALVPGKTSHLRGARHVLHKESDRFRGARSLAQQLGARTRGRPGHLEVTGGDPPRAIRWRGPPDHRLVMSAAVGAVALAGRSRIYRATSVSKSYPAFWQDLARLIAAGASGPA